MPVDDEQILAEDLIWRGVHSNLTNPCVPDGSGGMRLSSVVFNENSKDKKISVWIEKEVTSSGRASSDILDKKYTGILELSAYQIRNPNNLGIEKAPLADEPAHGNIYDKEINRSRGRWNKVKRDLARQARIIIKPAGC